ncbi:hypothetical protein KY285_011074 [Solanum tuberosum]|nr:hypothetical protein KY289_011621 [Solanum tuberosum]KAH0735367.1 hypothetical protein KY285_011074 [Solanum tuberosum]
MDDYDKNIALEVTETTPLSDWIRHLLKEREFIYSIRKGSNNVLTDDTYRTSLGGHMNDNVEGIEFPRLRKMKFYRLPEFQNFWPIANNSITHSNPLFHEKVCFILFQLL